MANPASACRVALLGLLVAAGTARSASSAETDLVWASGPPALDASPLYDLAETLQNGLSLVSKLRSKSWLEDWLWKLQIQIPAFSAVKGTFNFTVSNGMCTHFQLNHVETQKVYNGLDITASGLQIHCTLDWDARSTLVHSIHFSGDVIATVKDGSIGGPVTMVADDLKPPLPSAVHAQDCKGSIKVDLSFSGSGVSTVLEWLKPLIQSALNKRLTDIICTQLDTAINCQGSEALQNVSRAVRKLLADSPTPPPTPVVPDPNNELVDFGRNSGIELVHHIVTRVLGNAQSPHSANALLSKALGADGNLSLDALIKLPMSKAVNLNGLANLNFTVENVTFSHLNSWTAMDVYSPKAQEVALGLDMAKMQMHAQLKLGILPGSGPVTGTELEERFQVSVQLSELSLTGKAFLALNSSQLGTLTADQLGAMGCLSSGVDAASLLSTKLGAGSFGGALTPNEGSGGLEDDIDHMLNGVTAFLLGAYQDAVRAVGASLLIDEGLQFANEQIKNYLMQPRTCPPPENDFSNDLLSNLAMAAFIAFFMASIAACMLLSCKPKKGEARACPERVQEISVMTASTATGPTSLVAEIGSTLHPLQPHQNHNHALAFHPRTLESMRWGLPLLMIATMLMFLSSNSGIGAAVMVSITANGQPVVDLPPTFSFSLLGSIKDMCDGKVWGLALLILCFSGLWPYIKPIMMLICWFTPPSRLSVAKRQGLLNFLDAFGKWSLVDTFFMVLCMVAFKFDLQATQGDGLLQDIFRESGDDANLRVYVQPNLGFFTFLLATFCSLIAGHITTACHRWACQLGEFGVEDEGSEKRRLCSEMCTSFTDRHGPTIAISVSLVLVLCGTFLESFNFNFLGLAGYALGEGQHRPFSVFSLGTQIRESNPDPGSASILILTGVYWLFTIIVVVAYHVILIVMWTAPLTRRSQKQWFLTAQVFNAWSGLDVFCVTILAGVLEIREFAKFIVGDKCDAINKAIAQTSLADKLPGGVTCFDVDSTLRVGFVVLAAAAIISTITGHVMLDRCSHALCKVEEEDVVREEA